jgi:Zn-dependent peptidase ImmA (M78 family)
MASIGPVGVMDAEKEGAAAAEAFRRSNHLGVQPIGDLITVIEQATKIDVAILDVGPDEHGLTMRDPERDAVFIGVARTDRPMRQRSTLAHELAHALFDDCADSEPLDLSRRSDEEIRADAFARHLLLPIEALRGFLSPGKAEPVTRAALSDVVQRFLVSPQIAAIVLQQAGYIDEETKKSWFDCTSPMLATRYGWLDQYQALAADANRHRTPQRLLSRAIAGYELGVLPAQTIATLLGLSLDRAETVLRDAGIEPPAHHNIAWTAARNLPDVDIDLSDLDRDLADDGWG